MRSCDLRELRENMVTPGEYWFLVLEKEWRIDNRRLEQYMSALSSNPGSQRAGCIGRGDHPASSG